jgi:hypothetical protein
MVQGVLRSVIGSGLYLAVAAVFAFGIAALLRNTVGAITTAMGAVRTAAARDGAASELVPGHNSMDPVPGGQMGGAVRKPTSSSFR